MKNDFSLINRELVREFLRITLEILCHHGSRRPEKDLGSVEREMLSQLKIRRK